jgi:hypothetical protein
MYRRWFSLALELERQFGPHQRKWSVIGQNRGYTLRHFENAQLQGQVSVQIEDGSNMPKTALGKRAAIEQANQLRLIDPADPDQRYALLQNFGLSDLSPSLDVHVQSALQVQEEFEQWAETLQGPPPLVVKPWHNPQIHLNERVKWLNGDKMKEILSARPELEMFVTQHLAELQFLVAPPPLPGPDGGAPGGGQAMTNANKAGGTQSVPSGNAPGPNMGPA